MIDHPAIFRFVIAPALTVALATVFWGIFWQLVIRP